MSTSSAPVVPQQAPATQATHQSLVQHIEADLGKVGHAFVIGAEKLKSVIVSAESTLKADAAPIAEAETIANAVVSTIYPGAGAVALAIEAAMAKVFNAVDAAGDAASANGVNVQLDVAAVQAVKAALPTVKAQAQTTPGS